MLVTQIIQIAEFDKESYIAKAALDKIQKSGTTLSADPDERKKQFAELIEARMAVKVADLKAEKYMNHLADTAANEAVEALIKKEEQVE